MAITRGTAWYAPIDFGVTEGLSRFFGTPIGAYNPAQHAPTIGPETMSPSGGMGFSIGPTSKSYSNSYSSGGSSPSYGINNPQQVNTPTGGGFDYGSYLDEQYGALFSNLDQMEGSYGQSKTDQETMVNNAAQQTANTLTNTYNTNNRTLESNKTKNLNDLTDFLTNAWQSGNAMLGAKGASDSSAANQYSYALAKTGTKERGNILTATQDLQTNLKTAYDTEMQNNDLDKQNQLLSISQWYQDAINQVGGMRASLQAQKSQQALDYALQMVDQVNQVWASNKSILDQWAANKASSLEQLTAMLNQNTANMPTFQGFNTSMMNTSNGQVSTAPAGYSSYGSDDDKLFR